MYLLYSGNREAVIASLRALDAKVWEDLQPAIVAVEACGRDNVRAELKKVRGRWWWPFNKNKFDEIWITALSRTELIYLSQRPK